MTQSCLFCGGDASAPDHRAVCDGRQGREEAAQALFFDGRTYEPGPDRDRLARQLARVRLVMADHQWRTLRELSALTSDPQASVSARLRDLRKERFGRLIVERQRRGEETRGLFEYRVGWPTRHLIPASRTSWREADGTVRVEVVGAHCVDEAWPWWRPGLQAPTAGIVANVGQEVADLSQQMVGARE